MPLEALTPTSAAVAVTGNAGSRSGAEPVVPHGAPAPADPHVAAPQTAVAQAGKANPAELEAARKAANEALRKNGCELSFEFDDASGRLIARLIDTKTKEVLRQMPSRETLAIARALAEDRSNGVLLQANA